MTDPSKKSMNKIIPTGYEDLIKTLNLAIVQYVMYPHGHALTQSALGAAYGSLKEALKNKKELIFGVVENRLLVEDTVLDEANPLVSKFFGNFKRLKIDSLSFCESIAKEELDSLISVMAMREDAIEGGGGVKKILSSDLTPNIKLENVRYERLSESETIVSIGEGERMVRVAEGERLVTEKSGGAEEPKEQKQSFYKTMLLYLKGEIKDVGSKVDEKKLLDELGRSPKRTVTLLLEVGKEIRNLQLVVERMGDWLMDLVRREGSSLKKDLSQTMAFFGKKLQEELLSSGKTTESLKTSEALGTIVSQYVDRIKIDMITAKFKTSKKKSPKDLEKIMRKVVKTKEERDRILPKISSRIKDSGVLSDAEFNKALKNIKEIPLEGKKVEVPEAELKRLYEIEKQARKRKASHDVFADKNETDGKTSSGISGHGRGKAIANPNEVVISRQELDNLRKEPNNAEGEITSRVGAATKHLTEHNKELSADLERQSALLHEFSSGIIVVDREDRVILMNRAAEELLGIPKEKMAGHHILDQLKDEHLLALTRKKRTSSDSSIKQVELSTPNVQTRDTIKASTAVVEDEDGKTIGMLFVLTDVTKQRELEEAKESFLSRISSYLRDPVTSIRDNLIVLLSQTAGDLNEEQKRLVLMAKDNSESLAHSINELLTASEIRKKKVKLDLVKFDVSELIEGCLEEFQKFAEKKKVYLKKELPKDILEVRADREKVALVLNNLIANGLKAVSKGGEVTIGAGPYLDEQQKKTDFILVYVEDTGSGIPASEIDKVFEEFAHTGISDGKFSGLGLGLSYAKEIIGMHKGKIWAETKWGRGSKFNLILPAK
ncbi:MAG: cell wall metabolism sensor histidine kinase WalK [Candidatus Omnitrophica bacterium]|nr:cell wall metabolism sensor histidine kinase WalK [Candidatus Omnitrophota bacterium]